MLPPELRIPFILSCLWLLGALFVNLVLMVTNRAETTLLTIILTFGVPVAGIIYAVIYHLIRYWPSL
jgi:hypothetical protein